MALTSLTNLQPLHVHSVGVSTFDGSVSVGGTLTYEDVTNVDAIGIVTARSGIHIDDSIVHIGDTDTKIRFPANETISFDTNGSEKLRLTSAGCLISSNVGIGTNNRWKIRPNSGSEQLTFEYSTSANLHDNNIKFRFASAGQLGIGNPVNYGSSGQVLTSGGASSAASWSTITGTTINNNADNKIITGSGSANTLEAESNLTFNGTKLSLTPPANTGNDGLEIIPAGGSTASSFKVLGNQSSGAAAGRNGGVVQIDANYYVTSSDIFTIKSRGTAKLNMLGSGNLGIGTITPGAVLEINNNTGLQQLRVRNHVAAGGFSGNYGSEFRHAYSSANHGMLIHSQETGNARKVLDISNASGIFATFTNSRLGLLTDSPSATLHVNTSHYVATSSGRSTTGIHLDGTWGNAGEYGGGISFACGRDGSAAIAARQATSDGNTIGLSFFTHDTSTASANAVEKVRIHDGGATSFNNGIILGNGLSYDADHLMDDYEEGSYTPNVQTDNGVNCGMAVAQGYYVKVGKLVTVHLKIQTNSHNSVNTAAQYKVSLPFTSLAAGDTQGTLMCSIWSIGSSNISWMGGQVHNNNAWTHLAYHNGNNNNTNNLQPNNAGNQLQFRGTVVYRSHS